MRKRIVMAAVGCIAAGSVLLSGCASEVTATVPGVVQVQTVEEGEGKISLSTSETVKVVPDMAQITYGITTEAEDAAKCQQDNTEKLNQLLEYLKAQGLEEKSISTSGFSMNPRYDWSGNKQQLIGYEMQTTVTVNDIPIDQTGSMLTGGVAAGANEIYSVSYFSSTYDEAYAEALTKAVEQAKLKAEALAAASGQKVGSVVNIQEYGDNQYGRYLSSNVSMRKDAATEATAAAGADMGVMPGEMEVTANISIEFEMVQ